MIDEVIEYLKKDTKVKSVVLFAPRAGKKAPQKVTVTVTRYRGLRCTFKVTEGPLNYAESLYATKYQIEHGEFPTEWIRLYPKRKK